LRYHVVEDLGGEFIPFRLSKPPHGAGPPLGWSLSRRARDLIDEDLKECPNLGAFERVSQILSGTWAPARAPPR
jgi:hypothetical protein